VIYGIRLGDHLKINCDWTDDDDPALVFRVPGEDATVDLLHVAFADFHIADDCFDFATLAPILEHLGYRIDASPSIRSTVKF